MHDAPVLTMSLLQQVRWLLWHVFRYRDSRNKTRSPVTPTSPTQTTSDVSAETLNTRTDDESSVTTDQDGSDRGLNNAVNGYAQVDDHNMQPNGARRRTLPSVSIGFFSEQSSSE